MRIEDRLFAAGIADIAAAEGQKPMESLRCLVPVSGGCADALAVVLEERLARVDRIPAAGKCYDLIVLLSEEDEAALQGSFQKGTLVLDAVPKKGHSAVFDPTVPYRRIRVLVLQGKIAPMG